MTYGELIMHEDPGIYDPLAGSTSWYNGNTSFPSQLPSPEYGAIYNTGAFTVPIIPQVVDVEERPISQEAVVQNFYEGPKKKGNNEAINWVEKQPLQVPQGAREKYDKAAIQIYRVKDKAPDKTFGGLTPMKHHLLRIQSPLLIEAIEPILANVDIRPTDAKKIEIHPPFKELYFTHSAISDLAHREQSQTELKAYLRVLVEVMDEVLADASQTISALQSKKQISWSTTWAIFPKDIIVYSHVDGQDRLYQVVYTEQVVGRWDICCESIQFDGSIFGTTSKFFFIKKFSGVKPIADLKVYPIGFHWDSDLEKRLVERGRQVLGFQDICYREYVGTGLTALYADDEDKLQFHV